MSTHKYVSCTEADVPPGYWWDTPLEHQGQIVEVQYSAPRESVSLPDAGAPYKRVNDHSDDPYQWEYFVRSVLTRTKAAPTRANNAITEHGNDWREIGPLVDKLVAARAPTFVYTLPGEAHKFPDADFVSQAAP